MGQVTFFKVFFLFFYVSFLFLFSARSAGLRFGAFIPTAYSATGFKAVKGRRRNRVRRDFRRRSQDPLSLSQNETIQCGLTDALDNL